MKRSQLRFLGLAAAALVLVAACGSSPTGGGGTPSPTIKVGLVTDTGGLNDQSFNHLAALGLAKAASTGSICSVGGLQCSGGLNVQGDVVESKTGDEYVPNLTNFATKGYDLVIGNGFLMQPAIGTVAKEFPNVKFAIVDGYCTDAKFNDLKLSNCMDLLFKEQESGALVGAIAGLLEKAQKAPKNKNVIGAVGGISIPPVNHYIAGYKWAAEMVDPGVKVLVGYSNDFNAADKCKGVANSQIGQGADFIFQVAGGCGLGALQAAGQAKVYSFGVDADQKSADNSVIASALKKVDVAVYTAIQAVVQGKFASGENRFSLQNGATGYQLDNPLSDGSQLPADITAAVDKLAADIKSGAQTPPDTIPTT
jgi:basic membrane protein A and related proteins